MRCILLQTLRAAAMPKRRRGPLRTARKFAQFCVRHLAAPVAMYLALKSFGGQLSAAAVQSAAQLSTAAVQSSAEMRQGLVGFMTAEGAGRDLLVPVERGMEAAGMDVGRGLREGKPFFTFINVHRVCS
jgi:hypothetical protein